MKRLKEQIRTRQFERVYLLYGSEGYLKQLYRDRLRDAVLAGADTMNMAEFSGKGIDEKEVLAFSETLPFFADYRLLLLDNTGWFKNATGFADAVARLPDSTVIVFTEEEVDKRSRMFKAVKEHGYVCEMNGMTENELKLWIASLLKKENKKITESTVELLIERVGTDMGRLRCELEKLVCYALEREVITAEDVLAVCSEQLTGKIFALTDAIAVGQKRRALELYYDLLALQEKPLGILYMIERQFHFLILAKEMKREGEDRGAVAAALGVPPFVAGKYLSQSDRFPEEELVRMLTYSVQLEEDVKSGRLKEQLAVELLLA